MKDRTASRHHTLRRHRDEPSGRRSRSPVAAILAACALGCTMVAVSAEDLSAALGALQRLEYEEAATILDFLADRGDARAQAALATLIEAGKARGADRPPPLELLRAAAEQGLAEAALELGNRYYLGDGTTHDLAASVDWWRRASATSPRAAFNLGLAYARGAGVERDHEAAMRHFEQAARGGLVQGWFALGVLRLESATAEEDASDARAAFRRAADADLAIAQYNLATMLERGLGGPADRGQAIAWYRRAAAAGIARANEALTRLGVAGNVSPAAVRDTAWVLAQRPERYTLQLASSDNEDAVKAILARLPGTTVRATFVLRDGGNARCLALVGSFASRGDAVTYLESLPAEFARTKPWVRQFASVHALATP